MNCCPFFPRSLGCPHQRLPDPNLKDSSCIHTALLGIKKQIPASFLFSSKGKECFLNRAVWFLTFDQESVLARNSKERSVQCTSSAAWGLIAAAGLYCVPPLGALKATTGDWEQERGRFS